MLTRFRRLLPREQATTEDNADAGPAPASDTAASPEGASPEVGESADTAASPDRRRASRPRRIAGHALTALAFTLVAAFLLLPNQLSRLEPGSFVRIPLEGLAGAALLLMAPRRMRRPLAVLAGVGLGLITILKVVDIGFREVLRRPFNLVLDWVLLDDAVAFLDDSVGRAGAVVAVVAVVLLIVAVLALTTLSVLRLTKLINQHRRYSTRGVAMFSIVWLLCAALGVQLVPGVPTAAKTNALILRNRAEQVVVSLRDQQQFAKDAAVDAFRDVPDDQLLAALRGKDVLICFVESYGRDAIEDPNFATEVGAVLDDGTDRLTAAGFASRSAFLTSPTSGSGSWLAQSTFRSGLWIENQQRYRTLVASDRQSLPTVFDRAGWRTVGVMPGIKRAWPEGWGFGYEEIYHSRNLGYNGPQFSWAPMPDQYTLEMFHRLEHGKPDNGPVMAEIALASSHAPWTPLPRMVDWDDVGDGSIYGPMVEGAEQGNAKSVLRRDPDEVRVDYRRAVEYSLNSIVSYLETYGDDDTVLLFLGDHQPIPMVTGEGASTEVPITIVARDQAVLDRIAAWNWDEGLKPGPEAPVWRMDSFRDRFLRTFGPPAPGGNPSAAQAPSRSRLPGGR